MEKTIQKIRKSNFELLRLIAIFFIVFRHQNIYGYLFDKTNEYSFNYLFTHIINWPGNLGNMLFMLLSGYFLEASSFSWKRVLKMYLELLFYSSIIGIVMFIFKLPTSKELFNNNYGLTPDTLPSTLTRFGLFDLAKNCMPFLSRRNWYANAYFIFYAITPFLIKLVKSLSKKEHLTLFCILCCFTVISTFTIERSIKFGDLFTFINAFVAVTYIKYYKPKIFSKYKRNLLIGSILLILFTIYAFIVYFIEMKTGLLKSKTITISNMFSTRNSIFTLFIGLFLFFGFEGINIGSSKIINKLAGCSFGVYLLHNNPAFIYFLWHKIFHTQEIINSNFMPLYTIVITLIVVFVCSFIDIIRQYLFKGIEKAITIRKNNKK